MFKDEYHPQVKKDLKKIALSIQEKIKTEHIPKILENPERTQQLTSNFSGIYSYHFRMKKTDYRICYIIDNNNEIVHILTIGKRENMYDVLKRRFSY